MSIRLSNRVQQIQPSATIAISNRANMLRAQGEDILNLGVGEPDFDTPLAIKQAGEQAITQGNTRYTAVDGTAPLKQAIIDKLLRDNQLHYETDQILVSNGAKQSFFNLLQAVIDPGDEVLIPAPYWVSYPDMARLAGGEARIIETTPKQHFKITPSQLAETITTQTRLLVLNSPSNPTGVAYTREELAALGEVLLNHPQIVIASDEIYEHIYWGDSPLCNLINACPELYAQTVVINGVSKAYAMTGWRIGYAAGPKFLIAAMKKIQSQSTSCPSAISQAAASNALSGDQQCVKEMTRVFQQRHQYVCERLNQIQGIHCLPAHGAFYLFPNIREALASLQLDSDLAFAEFILNEAGVAIVPGSAFGSPDHFRLSFAASSTILDDALLRIKTAITGQ